MTGLTIGTTPRTSAKIAILARTGIRIPAAIRIAAKRYMRVLTGQIVYAEHAGPGWGNVIVVEHTASDGTKLRSLYGHLQSITHASGAVTRREQIGTVGSADGRYKCHQHFEFRWIENPLWDQVGPGYSDERHGWIDPSEFIEKQRNPATHW